MGWYRENWQRLWKGRREGVAAARKQGLALIRFERGRIHVSLPPTTPKQEQEWVECITPLAGTYLPRTDVWSFPRDLRVKVLALIRAVWSERALPGWAQAQLAEQDAKNRQGAFDFP